MRIGRLPLPSFPDLLFVSLLAVLFGRAHGLETLLTDGDIGWHIRTGEWILQSGSIPRHDLFSFSRPSAPWTAWEWLSDVAFAKLYGWHGLTAVCGVCGLVLCLASGILLSCLLARRVGLWLAAGATFAATSASTIHYLARPHVFSILLFTAGLWVLDRDRRSHSRLLWLLTPLTALWCNLHGGFVLWLVVLWLLATASAFERDRAACARYSRLAAWCSVATLLNPYGWNLHRHIAEYLASPWIMQAVQEFQPPQIRAENMLVFAVLLVAAAALAARGAARGQWFEPLLVWALGLAALRSARHVPFFSVAAAVVVASECAEWWSAASARRPPRSTVRVLWEMGLQLGRRSALTAWGLPLAAALFVFAIPAVSDFPAKRFPVRAVAAMDAVLAPADTQPRILTSDQWGDYVIFRLYPRQHVFFDGRSDFYGEKLGADYQALLDASNRAREVLDRQRFDLALLPHEWALERVLEDDRGWKCIYRDDVAALFSRRAGSGPLCPKEYSATVE
jgi:hypothetical protein